MKIRYHLLIQILAWAFMWFVMSLNQRDTSRFLIENSGAFVFQIVAIILASYVLVPRFLFAKKYIYFVLVTLPLLFGFAYLSTKFLIPNIPLGPGRGGPKPPSPIAIHFLIIAVAFILSVLVETFILAQRKEQAIVSAKAELMESELKMLKMQINPHFLFNALNNIYALSVTNSDKTQESISTLSAMLRYVIYDCERPEVPLIKELEYINNYIALFKLKSSTPFNITFIDQVADENIMVAPMLFVPYIENAFKHSGIEKGNDRFVRIELKADTKEIVFSVENSIPLTPQQNDAQGGIGLQNVKKRLAIHYPNSHTLDISTSPIYKVNLKVNI